MIKKYCSVLLVCLIVLAASTSWAQWVTTASTMPDPPATTNTAFVYDGKIYVIGGVDSNTFAFNGKVRIYDPLTDAWTSGTDAPVTLVRMRGALVDDVYYIPVAVSSPALTNIQIYDPAADSWDTGTTFAAFEAQAVGADPDSGYIYISGQGAPTKVYDPATDAYLTDAAAMNETNIFHCAFFIDGEMVAVGGAVNMFFSPVMPVPESYDVAGNAWTNLSPVITTPRWDHGCALYNGEIIVVGGRYASWYDALDVVESFSPTKGTWTTLDGLPKALAAPWTAMVGNYLFVGGGEEATTGDDNTDTYYLKLGNSAPVFTSTPVETVVPGDLYAYDADAEDEDLFDVVAYALTEAPTDMTIDGATGEVEWDTTGVAEGDYDVTIEADDGDGGVTEQIFTITVAVQVDDDTTDDDSVDDDSVDDDTTDDDDADDDADDDDDQTPIGDDDADDDDDGCGC